MADEGRRERRKEREEKDAAPACTVVDSKSDDAGEDQAIPEAVVYTVPVLAHFPPEASHPKRTLPDTLPPKSRHSGAAATPAAAASTA